MLYLTDQPDVLRDWLPPEHSWSRGGVAPLSPSDEAVWRCLGGGKPMWISGDRGDNDDSARIVLMDEAPGSQFSAVVDALKSGEPWPNTVIALALSGSGFRGQRNRPWTALRGNIHFTASFKIHAPVRDVETGLIALPAVAVIRAIETGTELALTPRVKWVNDVILENRKVSGVLTSTQVQGNMVTSVVFGIGLNVEKCPTLDLSPSSPEPGALVQFDARCAGRLAEWFWLLTQQVRACLRELLACGSDPLVAAYRERVCFVGRRVCIWPEDPSAAQQSLALGRVRGLNADLSLDIEGSLSPIRYGRMELLPAVE